jgi:DNA primase catalytic core
MIFSMGISGSRTLVDVLYEDILPRLSVEDAYPDVSFTHNRGRYWQAGCPIHGGEDPNFSVDTQTLSWTCFSHCGHGSYLAFLNGGLAPRGQRFVELVELLAARVGIQLDGISRSNEQSAAARRQALLEGFCTLASKELGQPEGAHVVTYLAARGFPRDAAELARLGFGAHPSWGMRYQMHAEAGDLTSAGLDDKRWGGRLLIPWRDEHGRIATIAARTIGNDEPRYLYLQGAPLPAFFRADRFRARADETVPLVVVEGLIDALLMRAVGTGNVVATGGTSISERHVEWIVASGFGKVVLAFDADEPGVTATRRMIDLLRAKAPTIRIQAVPVSAFAWAKDPAELIARDGPSAARDLLASKLPWLVWEADRIVGDCTPGSPLGIRRDALDSLASLMTSAMGPDRDADLEDVSRIAIDRLGYSEAVVRHALGSGDMPGVVRARSAAHLGHLGAPTVALLLAVCDGLIPPEASPASDEVVWSVVDALPPRLAAVLSHRFGRWDPPQPLEKVARLIADPGERPVSRERVRQLQGRGLKLLRARSRLHRLLGLVQEPRDRHLAFSTEDLTRLAEDGADVILSVGRPLGAVMLTHVLRGSTGPKTQRLVTACRPPHVGAYRSFLFDEVLEGIKTVWADIRRLVSEGSRTEAGGTNYAPNSSLRWDESSSEDLHAQWLAGRPVADIAAALGRSEHAVEIRLLRLGLAELAGACDPASGISRRPALVISSSAWPVPEDMATGANSGTGERDRSQPECVSATELVVDQRPAVTPRTTWLRCTCCQQTHRSSEMVNVELRGRPGNDWWVCGADVRSETCTQAQVAIVEGPRLA